MHQKLYPAILYLEDGSNYKGWSFINNNFSIGEIVFNTGMTGYQEIITDPSYSGQIITFTYPELGNTGLNNEDYESDVIHIKGIIAKHICSYPSNWRNKVSLPQYLLNHNIPHIFGIDTRALTKHLRMCGVMKAAISYDNKLLYEYFNQNEKIDNINLVNNVTTRKVHYITPQNKNHVIYSHLDYKISNKLSIGLNLSVVLLDFGVKRNIVKRLLSYGCNVYVLPIDSTYETISNYNPDGILLSNGPGDPAMLNFAVNTVQQLVKFANIPIFGICMGHQVLNIALGANTFKLKFGHRGLNHPAGLKQASEITSQNHGFAVDISSIVDLQSIIKVTHFNLNDLTVAGILHYEKPIFSVQYHPEASPGPHDSDYLFNVFVDLMNMVKK